MNKLILISFLFFIFSCMCSPNPTPPSHRRNLSKFNAKYEIGLNWVFVPQIILLGFGLVGLFWLMLLCLCKQVSYAAFNINLTLFKKKSNLTFPKSWFFMLVLLGMLVSEYPEDFSILFCQHYFLDFKFPIIIHPISYKSVARSCFNISCVLFFTNSVSPVTHVLSLFIFQILCHAQSSNVPRWLPLILILLANDIELNPGPRLHYQFLSFMN